MRHVRRSAVTTDTPDSAVFRQRMPGIVYESIPPLRQNLRRFLAAHGVSLGYSDRLMLSLSEILANIVRHPAEKADIVDITASLSADGLVLDIADNSTPFATFAAKCNETENHKTAAEDMRESGYGLGLIIRQHAAVCYESAAESADGMNHFRIQDSLAEIQTVMPDPLAGRLDLCAPPAAETGEKPVIFLVDDDPIDLKIIHRILSSHYDVMPLRSAAAALRLFRDRRPDLIISDLRMPDMDGMELRQALSTLEGGDATPFVFLSAVAEAEHHPYISRLGVDGYICKPVTEEKLCGVTSKVLTRARQMKHALEGKFHSDIGQLLQQEPPAGWKGWRLATRNRMAAAGGGDFILHHPSDNALTMILADVMGHGRQAKFFSYAYAGYLRALFRLHAAAADAGRLLDDLSRAVEDDSLLNDVVLTCQSFVLRPRGNISIATAGHPAPLLVSPQGCKVLDIAGPLPGLGGAGLYTSHASDFSFGDKVLFATDGFFHVFDPDGVSHSGILNAAAKTADAVAPVCAAALWQEFLERSDQMSQPADDATLIIAEYGGEPE